MHSHYTAEYRRRRFNDRTERQYHDNDNFDGNDSFQENNDNDNFDGNDVNDNDKFDGNESEQESFVDFSSIDQRNQDGGAAGPPTSK